MDDSYEVNENNFQEEVDSDYIIKRKASKDKRSVQYDLDNKIYKALNDWVIKKRINFEKLTINKN